jgi:hypothetical protein
VLVMAHSINIKISWLDVKQSAAMLCNLFLGELSMHYIKKEKEKLIYIYISKKSDKKVL